MINFRTVYEPWIKLCKELIEEKKELQEKLERTEFYLRLAERRNEKLKEMVEKLQDEKRKDLEKRVADLEQGKQLFLLDDNSVPIKSFTLTGKLTVMDEPAEEKLEVGKWYDARTFEVETLKKLLPVGTLVAIVTDGIVDEKRNKPEGDRSIIVHSTVTSVESEVDGWVSEETVIYVERYQFVSNNWFKIIEEY